MLFSELPIRKTLKSERRWCLERKLPDWDQAFKLIKRFGGEAEFAKALGLNLSTVYKLNYPQPYGRGGLLSSALAARVAEVARREGILLLASDWIPERIIDDREKKEGSEE